MVVLGEKGSAQVFFEVVELNTFSFFSPSTSNSP